MASCSSEGSVHASQGTTVSWGGDNIGMLTSFNVRAGRTNLIDITPTTTTVVGDGWESRCCRKVGVGAIEPATVSLSVFSGPNSFAFTQNQRGANKELLIKGEWGQYQGNAILLDYTVSGSVGEPVQMTAEFTFEGG